MSGETKLRVLDIVDGTTVDGPGFRTSIYFAGCAHCCRGCHNPQSWDMAGGREMSVGELLAVIDENDMDVTLTGGDPVYQAAALEPLVRGIAEQGRTVWLFTGFLFEELLRMEQMRPLLPFIEVVVDGPYEESLRDTGLLFRGSSNQRLIDVAGSMRGSGIELWDESF